jgi:hypothetical protein
LWGGKFSQLLANDAHLLLVIHIGGDALCLLADRGARPSARSRLAERGSYGVGVRESLATNDIERCCRRVVEANMKRSGHAHQL